LLNCIPPIRTASLTGIANKEVRLYLQNSNTKGKIDLIIPDIAGESFMLQFTDRIWDLDYKVQVENSSGLLLFINPEFLKPHVLIDDIAPAIALLEDDDEILVESSVNVIEALVAGSENEISEKKDEDAGANDVSNVDQISPEAAINNGPVEDFPEKAAAVKEEEKPKAVPFEIKESPTQVVLIDILENHKNIILANKISAGIVISAWDEVLQLGITITPRKWLSNELPLLYQYLISNYETIDFEVFGISAQGGSFKDPEIVKKLKSFDEPSDRILVQQNDEEHKDICIPIDWLITQWQSRQ